MKRRNKIIIIVAAVVVLLPVLAYGIFHLVFGPQGLAKQAYEFRCKAGGGSIEQHSNTCGDDCYDRDKYPFGPICGEAMTYKCSCGPDKCWSGLRCVKSE